MLSPSQVTLTTVGYGDVYPVTPIGKLFGALLAFLGIGLFALPAGIIASGFSEQIERQKARSPEKNIAKPPLETDVEQSAELMKRCLDIAYEKFSDRVRDEAILRDLAVKLYDETQHNRGR
ncbi:potassium channel family protein [Geitlerinema sp. CS-897]|nr:potassium channel family protein [Geitlerinema sp. CS-897]